MTFEEFEKEEARLSEEVRIFESEARRKKAEYNNFIIANLDVDLEGPITHMGIARLVRNVIKMGECDAKNQTDNPSDNQEPEAPVGLCPPDGR